MLGPFCALVGFFTDPHARRPVGGRTIGEARPANTSKTRGHGTVEFQSDQVSESPASTMPHARATGKKKQVCVADTNECADGQWPVREHQGASSAEVPQEGTHLPDLPFIISPYDRD